MSYISGTIPKNFEEYVECYKNELIVRQLFPRKDIIIGNGDIYEKEGLPGTISKKYDSYCISSGYEARIVYKPTHSYINERLASFAQIIATEDNMLFHGSKANYLKGLDNIATKFNGSVHQAIEKYHPARIVANRTMLKDLRIDIPINECQFVENGIYYLFPEITSDIAEFVVWKDVYEDPVPFRRQCGTNFYDIYEWVAIAIHEPKKFIKVV